MENQISSLALFFFTLMLTYFDYKRFNNLLTPFAVTMLPIATISMVVNFLYSDMGILPVTARVNIFLLLMGIAIWIPGLLFKTHPRKETLTSTNRGFLSTTQFLKFLPGLIGIAILIFLITLNKALGLAAANGGYFFMASYEFEVEMTRGWVAHLNVFGQAVFIWLFIINKNSETKWPGYMAIVALAFSNFLLMVKYNILWLIMIAFFINNIHLSPKKQISKAIKTMIGLSTVFILHFVVLLYFWNDYGINTERAVDFLYTVTLNYFLSGPIVLDIWLSNASIKPDWALFIVFENFWNFIVGNPLRIRSTSHLSMGFESLGLGIYSNIGTAFGVYVLIGGKIFSFAMSALFSIISYWSLRLHTNFTTISTLFMVSFLLTINSLSFFNLFVHLLSFYQLPAFFFLIFIIFKLLNFTIKEIPNAHTPTHQ